MKKAVDTLDLNKRKSTELTNLYWKWTPCTVRLVDMHVLGFNWV